jgi:hypothetical protein
MCDAEGQYLPMCGDGWPCGAIWSDARLCRPMPGDSWQCEELDGDAARSTVMRGYGLQ